MPSYYGEIYSLKDNENLPVFCVQLMVIRRSDIHLLPSQRSSTVSAVEWHPTTITSSFFFLIHPPDGASMFGHPIAESSSHRPIITAESHSVQLESTCIIRYSSRVKTRVCRHQTESFQRPTFQLPCGTLSIVFSP